VSEILDCRETGVEIHNHGVTELEMAKLKAHKLWKKYVQEGAELEINIGAQERAILDVRLGNVRALFDDKTLNEQDLLLMFDNCKSAMKKSLIHSLARFKKTDDYLQVIAALTVDSTDDVIVSIDTNHTIDVNVDGGGDGQTAQRASAQWAV